MAVVIRLFMNESDTPPLKDYLFVELSRIFEILHCNANVKNTLDHPLFLSKVFLTSTQIGFPHIITIEKL
jgi:hypothetical protein